MRKSNDHLVKNEWVDMILSFKILTDYRNISFHRYKQTNERLIIDTKNQGSIIKRRWEKR